MLNAGYHLSIPRDPERVVLVILLFFQMNTVDAQVPGESYFDATGFVEYIAGDYPIVISVPHGGILKPENIPDRDCTGCAYSRDAFTEKMGRRIAESFYEQTGHYPHVIINLLHRRKFDANRPIGDAADGNEIAEEAWESYQNFIVSAKNVIVQDFDRGLFLDLHGHAHDIERVELGYTLTQDELMLPSATLNTDTYIKKNSINSLLNDNPLSFNHSEMLTGPLSFGTLLTEKGYPSVPSISDPFPEVDESYFTGGYNVIVHGSRNNGGPIDAIQIECNKDIRFDVDLREEFTQLLTTNIIQYISIHYGVGVIDLDADGVKSDQDCDDFNAFINPNQEEIPYNDIDDDCNPDTLDNDLDGDGFLLAEDCDDNDPQINPDQEEIPYNGIDDDCNPNTPDDDLDSDGFPNAQDCDDSDAQINPDQDEVPYNGIDDDCAPDTLDDDLDQDEFPKDQDCDDTVALVNPNQEEIPHNDIDDDCNPDTPDDDLDGDGFLLAQDCDDNDPQINPAQEEIPYNGIDDDCNPDTPDEDLDGDGFPNAQDCDDANAQINPDQDEVPYNGIDDDCDPDTLDDDLDGDGFLLAQDCDDTNALINPDQNEIPFNAIDDDCDPATLDNDSDQDGFSTDQDCNDLNVMVNPNSEEIPYNGIDDDCNPNTLDDDMDGDGFPQEQDCDDTNALINQNQDEIPYNGIDDDCNPDTPDDDFDGDGFPLDQDCNDAISLVNPNAKEIPYNGLDDDCDPSTPDDDLDSDGYVRSVDCNDTDPSVNPGQTEIPQNGIDEDCNGTDLIILEAENENSFIIFPNPAKNYIHIKNFKDARYRTEIFDTTGKLLAIKEIGNKLNVAHLANGPYIIVFTNLDTGKKTTKQIVVLH